MADIKHILDQRTSTTHDIVGVVDPTLAVSGKGADAKTVGDALATKAEVDGYYEELTSGNAEQLISSVGVEDSTPYNFRTTGGSADVGNRMNLRKVVGGTVAWNQLLQNGNFANGSTEWSAQSATLSVSNGVARTTMTGASWNNDLCQVTASRTKDHIYLCSSENRASTAMNVLYRNPGGSSSSNIPLTTDWSKNERIFKLTSINPDGGGFGITLVGTGASMSGEWYETKNFNCFDLTQMFGSTIADYIYGLEQSHAGDGVAWFRSLFPKPYYAFDAGSLQSVKTNKHKTVGFNALSSVTNGDAATQYTLALYGKADLLPNTTYCLSFVGASGHYLYPNENLFTTSGRITLTGNRQYIVLTTLSNVGKDITNQYDSASGWKLLKNGTGNTVVPNFTDVCLNLHWDGERDGEYEPYEAHEYALDDVELRGIPKLDANNNLYYDGDEYTPDGVVNRRYGIVDLGTLTWTKSNTTAGNWWFSTAKSDAKKAPSNTEKANVICSNKYSVCTPNQLWAGNEGIGINAASAQIVAVDETYETVEAFKTAMSGVYLVYELETPTTESADPYQETQIVDDFGTEEFVDAAVTASTPTRDVEIPVGHDSYFQSNLRAKLEMAPDSPSDGNGDYVVRQTNGTNEYVKLVIPDELPDNPTTDGNYVLKCTVSNGTATLTWEAQS